MQSIEKNLRGVKVVPRRRGVGEYGGREGKKLLVRQEGATLVLGGCQVGDDGRKPPEDAVAAGVAALWRGARDDVSGPGRGLKRENMRCWKFFGCPHPTTQ